MTGTIPQSDIYNKLIALEDQANALEGLLLETRKLLKQVDCDHDLRVDDYLFTMLGLPLITARTLALELHQRVMVEVDKHAGDPDCERAWGLPTR